MFVWLCAAARAGFRPGFQNKRTKEYYESFGVESRMNQIRNHFFGECSSTGDVGKVGMQKWRRDPRTVKTDCKGEDGSKSLIFPLLFTFLFLSPISIREL